MSTFQKALPWTIRTSVSVLFLLSAVAKLYPSPYFALSTFEVKQLYTMGFSENLAAYFSRTLIGIEFSLGVLLLLPFYLKKLVIPTTALMLTVFVVHLSIEIASGGNTGNCGCFGSLLPMTPLQAIIKNVISIGLLGVLYKIIKEKDKKAFMPLLNVVLASVLLVFMLGMKPSRSNSTADNKIPEKNKVETTVQKKVTVDSIKPIAEVIVKDTVKPIVKPAPKKKKSGYASLFPNIDEGKKIVCFFAPDCDHCRSTIKLLTALRKADKNFPPVHIIFMDEAPETIPSFFDFAGKKYPYHVMDIIEFWKRLGKAGNVSRDVPGVVYLWNGNVQKFYYGTEGMKFSSKDFKKLRAKE